MESILQAITDNIMRKNREVFAGFSPDGFQPERTTPLYTFREIIDEKFLPICELKRSSPSKGIIREDFRPLPIAKEYEAAGAGAISVLTEEDHFMGSPEYLSLVKENVELPVLRKDFVIHEYQVYESYNMGADMVLLICSCLDSERLFDLYHKILSLGMTPLVEVHDRDELEKVLELKGKHIIGVNNRDLSTFRVDIQRSFDLIELIPENIPVISESGISTNEDVTRLKRAGFAGILVGESLLRERSPGEALKRLLNG